MLANWKPLAVAAIRIVTMLLVRSAQRQRRTLFKLRPRDDVPPTCVAQRGAPCTIDIRYAYPAAELFVLPEVAYF